MVHCCAVDCFNSSAKCKNVSFFKLPRDQKLRKQWISKIKRTSLPKEENIRVCHKHFDDECFKRDLQVSIFTLFQEENKNSC